ncbi:hypothetical protein HK098_002614 [Nowakowskiella sp. JEL0407]|nr:hypothetical protein HK098_002614 [Nowakowskiella sp. JEL0407]
MVRRPRNKTERPRWWNQTYLVFLALRQAGRPLSRGELIPAALKLEGEIAKQRGLPLLFHGKTPQNTASAILTENRDHLFVGHKPKNKGEKWTFSLSYEPGSFENAKRNYDEWTRKLTSDYYPRVFTKPTRIVRCYSVETDVKKENDELKVKKETDVLNVTVQESSITTTLPDIEQPAILEEDQFDASYSSPTHGFIESDDVPLNQPELSNIEQELPITPSPELDILPHETMKTVRVRFVVKDKAKKRHKSEVNTRSMIVQERMREKTERPLRPTFIREYELVYAIDDSVEAFVPSSLDDILEVKESSIPNAGRGLFAKRRIPRGVILGYYFGVPMTEDEFDAIKDNVGVASHYSHRYRNFVLDATDENGNPFMENHPSGLFCPFHFMNDNGLNANMIFLEGKIVNQVECMTIRNIEPGEELCANYGNEIEKEKWKLEEERLKEEAQSLGIFTAT